MTDWILGDSALLFLAVTDVATGDPMDASAISLRIERPDGTHPDPLTLGAGITRVALGIYTARVALTQSGDWFQRWQVTSGDVTTVHEPAPLSVRRSRFET